MYVLLMLQHQQVEVLAAVEGVEEVAVVPAPKERKMMDVLPEAVVASSPTSTAAKTEPTAAVSLLTIRISPLLHRGHRSM